MSNARTTAPSVAEWITQAKVEPTFAAQTVCGIVGCTSIPFVEVKSREQRVHVCLSHFQEARDLAAAGRELAASVA